MRRKLFKLNRWHKAFLNLILCFSFTFMAGFILKYQGFHFNERLPFLTSEMEFKRLASSYLITDFETIETMEYKDRIFYIAQTKDSNIISWTYKSGTVASDDRSVHQFPKDQVLLFLLNGWQSIYTSKTMDLMVLPNVENAAYAILTASLTGFESEDSNIPDTTYEFKTEQKQDGFFVFSIETLGKTNAVDQELFYELQELSNMNQSCHISNGVILTVDFYDSNGEKLKSCKVY